MTDADKHTLAELVRIREEIAERLRVQALIIAMDRDIRNWRVRF
jgi:hypothetical protein